MKKLLIFINCLILLSLSLVTPAFAAEEEDEGVKTFGEGYQIEKVDYEPGIALLVNADTDTVIYSKNADKVTAPASLTKIVTALVALEECDDIQTVITCSYNAVHSIDGTGSAVVGFVADEKITLEMLIFGLFLPGGNDASAVIAEHFGGGDQKAFVNKMNDYVKKLGCKNTYFANPHGLDDDSVKGLDSDNQSRTTARDMYLIAKKALANETISHISSEYDVKMPKTNKSDVRWRYNTNPLLNHYSPYFYDGIIGLKTASSEKAGDCLITSATKDGYTYIAIAMRGRSDYYYKAGDINNANTAYLMCRHMLRWAFSNMKMKTIADGNLVLAEAGVKFGRGSDYVGLVSDKPLNVVVHKDLSIDDLKVKLDKSFSKVVDAPLEKGEKITTATLMYEGIKVAEVDLVAYQSVKRNYLWAAFSWLEDIASSKYFLLVGSILVIAIIVLLKGTKKKRRRKKRLKNQINVVKDYSNLARK